LFGVFGKNIHTYIHTKYLHAAAAKTAINSSQETGTRSRNQIKRKKKEKEHGTKKRKKAKETKKTPNKSLHIPYYYDH